MQGGVDTIKPYVDEFIAFAKEHKEYPFMKRIILGTIVILVSGIVLTGFLLLNKDAESMPIQLSAHSVLLTIDEVSTGIEPMYQATIVSNDTQLVSPPLINSSDLNRLLAREGKIYINTYIGAHKQLFQTLREFIESNIEPHDTIYTLLNGLSWNLAIEAIPLDSDDVYLCDKYYFERISSVKQINNHPFPQNNFKSILFGDIKYNSPKIKNLPGSKHAIAYLRELYPANGLSAEIYAQEAATAEAFMAVSGRCLDNILVSTHGEMNTQTDGSKAYEILFDNAVGVPTYKIAKMDLSHIQTIFFTACHSACFSPYPDECLRTALKEAGANTVIMHIWRTSDNAAEVFMKSYYSAWLSGLTPREAFLQAQHTLRTYRDDKGILQFEEPAYWAGFIMLD